MSPGHSAGQLAQEGMESLGTGGVPVSLLCHNCHFLAGEAVLEEIENGELVS